MENEAKKREALLTSKRIEIDKLREQIAKQAPVLSSSALEEKRSALEKRARDFDAEVKAQREELERKSSAAIGKVVAQIDGVVKEFGAERGCKMILERDERLVIYAKSGLDITDEVLKALDSKKIGM